MTNEELAETLSECDRLKRKAINEWLESNRKYPNGFQFPYHEETATIIQASRFGGSKTAHYIVYHCQVPSWRGGRQSVIVTEFAITRHFLDELIQLGEEAGEYNV